MSSACFAGVRGADSWFRVVGRLRDLVVRGGERASVGHLEPLAIHVYDRLTSLKFFSLLKQCEFWSAKPNEGPAYG